MKKPARSSKAPAGRKGSMPGPFIESGHPDPDNSGPAGRQEVRQEIHRTNVPRQSQRPAERSNQRRSRKP
ncbi:MAG: hypothetical protein EHM16_10890 [Betaproteobacteria bacterium]|nr:MAG: hypothetical protein EHM16_10890 [Betaproteobacteria bacterium]